ncbi:dihydroxyacetone kinase subunit DhaL [Halalkalicoccus jeotgali]|uniref:Dihydroxyacetone kinase n=1 Tax=Halalkalicoccus jeotgali (strain DSM 18796 / CECT 7217 / JCM 14584 / KCTC 4019 / B3) TaxID=795797 RepID=D8J2D3_HALJB|nr:dihydroxyacetone kinase subunit DhaL [Halalkalicoccus jeotgali]ADJ14890.1 dihydroxyacetone kinase [Halalkalicoccus jeotgali B3]ELY39472.1 dihydroxyacetone kinase [Halalkalicoccus jeotgali B3]
MDEGIQREALVATLAAIADRIESEKDHLTDLDSAIGDADHGANLHRGFQAALDGADPDDDPAAFVKAAGMALLSKVGGASGPLYGGSLAVASSEFEEGITTESSVAFAEAYLEKVKDRGGASVGDKTMVDALTPAVHTYKRAIEVDDLDPLAALSKAVDATERGVRFTTPIRASKGRASYLGWRSVGHPDPGATSTLYLLEEIHDVAAEYLDGEAATVVDAAAETEAEEGSGVEE